MQALTKIDETARSPNFPAPLPRASSDRLSAWEMRIDGGEISADVAPTDEQRAAMSQRAAALRGALLPALEDERRAELATMFAVLAFKNVDADMIPAMRKIYLADLADIPVAALREACAHFRRTEQWVPSIADIRAEAAHHSAPWGKELRRIETVLSAKVTGAITPEVARKRSAAVERWENEIRPQVLAAAAADQALMRGKPELADALASAAKPETPDEALARLKAMPLPQLSPATLERFGIDALTGRAA